MTPIIQNSQSARHAAERLARWIRQRGLLVPATVLLETLQPFGFVASQLLVIAEPLFGEKGRASARDMAALLEDRQQLDALIEDVAMSRPGSPESGG